MTSLSEKGNEGFGLSENAPVDDVAEAASEGTARIRKRGGRPKKLESERRRHKYLVSANDAERTAIETAAEAAGLAPSAYLREAGVGGGSGGRIERRTVELMYHKLSRLGVHLQTLARRMADEGEAETADRLEKLVGEVVELRSKL
jgi:hypothetical protein